MPTTPTGWERATKRAEILRRLRVAYAEMAGDSLTRASRARTAKAQADYNYATHPTQRIEAWLKLTRAGGFLSDNRMDDLEMRVRSGWGFEMPTEVVNIRMMG